MPHEQIIEKLKVLETNPYVSDEHKEIARAKVIELGVPAKKDESEYSSAIESLETLLELTDNKKEKKEIQEAVDAIKMLQELEEETPPEPNAHVVTWEVHTYDAEGNMIDTWKIKDKTEAQARDEVKPAIGSDVDDWTLTPMKDGGEANNEGEVINVGGNYLSISATKNRMIITLTPEGVAQVKELREDGKSDHDIMPDLFEDIQGNSELEWHPDLGNQGIAMTSASGVTDGYYYDDDGNYTDEGHQDSRLYYFDDYALRSEVEDMLERDGLILSGFDNKMAQGGEVGEKKYYRQDGIGKAKYTISMHDGVQTHKDGSPFYGIAIFSNKKERDKYEKKLLSEGYVYRYDKGGQVIDRIKDVPKGYKLVKAKGKIKTILKEYAPKMVEWKDVVGGLYVKETADGGYDKILVFEGTKPIPTKNVWEIYPNMQWMDKGGEVTAPYTLFVANNSRNQMRYDDWFIGGSGAPKAEKKMVRDFDDALTFYNDKDAEDAMKKIKKKYPDIKENGKFFRHTCKVTED